RHFCKLHRGKRVNLDFCPIPPRGAKWHPDSAPIAFFRGGAVNVIMANRSRSLVGSSASVLVLLCSRTMVELGHIDWRLKLNLNQGGKYQLS
ncbi:Uncharacterized protein APZ42_009074, partial [Daphnia magna]